MAYTASIAIAVKGIQDVKALQEKINAAAEGVNKFNNYAKEAFGGDFARSINNLNKALRDSAAAFDAAALGTSRAADAASAYLAANREMIRGLQDRKKLLQEVSAQEAAEAAARMKMQFSFGGAKALPAAGQTSFTGEVVGGIGGGARAALQNYEMLVGAAGKLAARTKDSADQALRFATATTQQTRPLDHFLQIYTGIYSKAVSLSQVKALPDSQMLNASARGLQTIESIEARRLDRANRLASKLQEINNYYASAGKMANAGVGVQGPAVPPKGIKPGGVLKQPGVLDAILGGGFPLLFGAGPGAVLGGAAGGFAGGAMGGMAGMALSIGLSAVGQQLDAMTAKVAEIGKAIDTLNIDTLRDSFIYVNAELTTTVRRLQEAGKADEARLAIATEVAAQTGVLPSVYQATGDRVNALVESWNRFLTALSGAGTILGDLIIPGITGLLNLLTKVTQGANILYQVISFKWIGAITEYIMKQQGQSDKLDKIREKMYGISEEEQKRIAILQQVTDKQHTEIVNNAKILQLEQQRQLGRTQAEKEINAALDSQLAKDKIVQEYSQKAKDLRTEYAAVTSEAGKRELELALGQNEALKTQALKQQEIKDSLVQQGLAIEANTEKYNQAATAVQNQIAALDRGNAVTNSRYGVEAALNDLYGAQLERQYQLATTETERFQIALKMFDQQINAARIEYNQALANNQLLVQKAVLEAKLTEIKLQQLEAEKQISLAYAESRGATPEVLAKLSAGYDKGLKLQQSVVEESYKQLQATSEIAANQDKVAEAVYKTKVIQAESQLAQKLASDEIGMSKENADQLAGALAIGVSETQKLNGAMGDVAASAQNAASQITSAFYAQQKLNAAQGGGAGKTTAPTGAAAGAYWKGGFKAFAKGGMVNKPTLGLIGEGGEPEYIVPESKAKNFAVNYMMGARGAAAIPKFAEGGYAGPSSASVSIQTGPVMQMNGGNYVTTAQMQQAVQAGVDRTLALIAGDQNMRRSVGIY